jgi:shikimate dehydrogenase
MHQCALNALNLAGTYTAIDCSENDLAGTIDDCRGQGFSGLNVTVPHKLAVMGFCDELNESAQRVGAVNTLIFRPDGSTLGSNTDLAGILASLPNQGAGLHGDKVLVIGSGGAARAVIAALKQANAGRILVCNRNAARAEELGRAFAVDVSGVDGIGAAEFAPSIVINATSVGMNATSGSADWNLATSFFSAFFPPHCPTRFALDLVYEPRQTPFMHLAKSANIHTINGLPMLAHQGALSLSHWIGVPIETTLEAMRRALDID